MLWQRKENFLLLVKCEIGESWREMFNLLIKGDTKSEVRDGWRKMVNWMVKCFSKDEMR